jgi:hypothetical protein
MISSDFHWSHDTTWNRQLANFFFFSKVLANFLARPEVNLFHVQTFFPREKWILAKCLGCSFIYRMLDFLMEMGAGAFESRC